MQILNTLGITSDVFYQLAIFLITFIILSKFVFEPYFKAFLARQDKTTGSEDHAERLTQQALDLHHEYEQKARAVNQNIQSIYEKARLEAMRIHDQIVTDARNTANQYLDENRKKIEQDVVQVREKLKGEVPALTNLISDKMLK